MAAVSINSLVKNLSKNFNDYKFEVVKYGSQSLTVKIARTKTLAT